ncbi:MAG: hypothetical protein IKW57_01580 [Alphaproteobacteria bacterium]|nr:hypothetical protein [Alphaproteobacteria bacterium]
MAKISKLFYSGAISLWVCMMVCAAMAATGRADRENVRTTTIGATGGARMPSMPVLPIGAVGNIATNVPDNGGVPQPEQPNPNPEPKPEPECPDGGVKNSTYTIENCMTDVLNCVNNGALPNGLNDMFNEDLRNAIVNGMGLCAVQVDKCVSDVRRDCVNVYRSAADVWIDFNSRRVQPEYYSFVLRKTGLTPNQAENTCRLLDKNTYGPSFAAVANDGKTTSEYNQQVGAYNSQQGNVLIKTNPQGVQVNDNNPGVDGQRGHYARWDATTATCLIRVAAYNKDSHITNSWLFGAVGDDRPAEVWQAAGETFSCDKDLFGFSLMKDTSTVAVVGVGGGTLVGAGVGAIAGHGKRDFDCDRQNHREMLTEYLKDNRTVSIVNEYINKDVNILDSVMNVDSCGEIVELFDKYNQFKTAAKECVGKQLVADEYFEAYLSCEGYQNLDDCFAAVGKNRAVFMECLSKGFTSPQQCTEYLYTLYNQGKIAVDNADVSGECTFKALNLDKQNPNSNIYCWTTGKCVPVADTEKELARLNNVFDESVNDLMVNGEKSNMGKSIGIGAAVGAGTGGLATAITAFVERNNINCRVGDGLAQVGYKKSYSIGNLKDFYVKWNLRLPDVVAPTATINDCVSWRNTCATFTDLEQCKLAQFNYKPAGAATTTLVHGACMVSGSACVENYAVAKSHGACE